MKKIALVVFMLLCSVSLGFGDFAGCIEECKERACSKICDEEASQCMQDCKDNNKEITSKCHHECVRE